MNFRVPISAFRLLPFAFCILPLASPSTFHVSGDDPEPWPKILRSAGLVPGLREAAQINVVRPGYGGEAEYWAGRVEKGAVLILEGESNLAAAFGFRPTSERVRVTSVEEVGRPRLEIVWENAIELPVFEVPPGTRIFSRERRRGAPLVAGFRRGAGAVLWVAASPGVQGYERFPCLLDAAAGLGLTPPFRSRRLWAFFDSSYRARVDLDYLAQRWRTAGIAALHVAAWHYYEPDAGRDEYLRKLIETCRRNAILVYAWLELPHVSEKFWNDHPEWREKTALLQDAHLDWRKLMNLTNRRCSEAVGDGVERLIERFDWDGINLAELYFESLQGHENPSRFTPMNEDVRSEFAGRNGFDPIELFDKSSARHYSQNRAGLRAFLDFRAGLALRIQGEWIARLEALRRRKPDLDLVVTHVDDRFDTRMRDAIGADAAGLLALIANRPVTFMVEDPATVWHLGPARYREIAWKYAGIARDAARLAVDINIVERYQDVYPTKQQTGVELYQLVSHASRSFGRVALYSENSILAPDAPWLASAASVVNRFEQAAGGIAVESLHGVGVPWNGPALVNGRLWPVTDGETVWLPPGAYMVGTTVLEPPVRLLDFTGRLKTAGVLPGGLEFTYESPGRALARLDRKPRRVEIDGVETQPVTFDTGNGVTICLPGGQHIVEIAVE